VVSSVLVFKLLLVKIGGFALLMGLASLNKWRLGPAIARGELPALTAFRRSVATEYTLIAGVLTATTVMTTFFSPDA
jgi:copper resistance protein D